MAPLILHSERFRPEGGAAGQGIMRALGRPRLDQLSVLVRESVQNSWDARLDPKNNSIIEFSAFLEGVTRDQLECLKKIVFNEKPAKHPIREHLSGGLKRLILQDRGTLGLNGPVFVERPPRPEDRFVNFCRMFGRASEGALGGGTYGYGKAVYYGASQAASIIVHTRSRAGGNYKERLIGMSLWKTNPDSLDTGRYWWGAAKGAPIENNAAAKLAAALGFRPFNDNETGTSIMIIAPKFESAISAPEDAARCIAESMAIWFWPRMLGCADDLGHIKFAVSSDGKPVAVPDPKRHSPFNLYAAALDSLVRRARKNKEVQPPSLVRAIRIERPAARLGWLSLSLAPRHVREDMAICKLEGHAFADQVDQRGAHMPHAHHVALLRGPGQVIKYMPCRAYPDEGMEYAGLFLVDGEADNHDDNDAINEAFAKSEPPSHDDWTPDDLEEDWHRRYVRVALREIKNVSDEFADAGKPIVADADQEPLGAISAQLGELMSAPGPGASSETRGGGVGGGIGGGGANGVKLQITGDGILEMLEGSVVFALPFRVLSPSAGATIEAFPKVLVAGGGTESEAPTGDDEPEVIGWRRPNGNIVRTSKLRLKKADDSDWHAIVRVPTDAMVGVTLQFN